MSATPNTWSLPWRTILAVLGGGLFLSQGASLLMKLSMDMSAADAASREIFSHLLMRNMAMGLLGAAMFGLGLTLAIKRRAHTSNMKKAG